MTTYTAAVISLQVPVTIFSVAPGGAVFFSHSANNEATQTSGAITPNVWASDPKVAFYSWNPGERVIYWNTVTSVITDQKVKFDPTLAVSTASTSLASSTLPSATLPSATLPSATPSPTTPSPTTPNSTSQPMSTPSTAASGSIQSSPSQTPAPHRPNSNGISKGAAAGIGVGCLLAGALMAALIFFLCTARARKRQRNRDREAGTVPFLKGAIPLGTKEQNLESSPNSYNLESSLAQPLEDKAISGDISKINNSVKNHVQSYYHGSKLSPGLLDHDDLQALGSDLPMSPGTLSTLLANPDTREIALRFSIAWVLVSRIRLDSHPRITFLPPEIAQCVQSMGIDIGGARGTRAMFFSKWQVISAELLQNSYGGNPISPGDPRNHNISSALDALDGVLRPFADSRMDNNQRRRNLEEILKRAASFAFVLFSQPSSWVFDWQDQDAIKSGSLCIFPSLVQVTDDAGEVLKQPRPFSEAIIRQLDG